jgi:heme-degrading monooxygenase HmoA
MVITVFRSRLKPDATEYGPTAERMSELARTMPGYIAHKVFTAEDGERVTIVEFESAEAQEGWRKHAEHLAAQRKGRRDFYSEYRLQVCNVVKDTRFP